MIGQKRRRGGCVFIECLETRMFLSAGDLDVSFSGNGKQAMSFGEGISVKAFDVAVQSDGKTVVVGRAVHSDKSGDFAVARFNLDGTPDPTFGPNGNGTVLTHVGRQGRQDSAASVVIQPDGKIVVAGVANSTGPVDQSAVAIARYMPDGTLDKSFSTDGKVSSTLGEFSTQADDVILQGEKILIAGFISTGNGTNGSFLVARFTSDGNLDGSFGNGGKRIIDFGQEESASAITIDSSGTKESNPFFGGLVVVGHGPQNVDRTSRSFAIARLTPNGSLDDGFGPDDNGKLSRGITGTLGSGAEDVLIQANGKIVVCGAVAHTDTPNDRNFALMRFRRSGQLDTTFGSAGTGLIEIDFGADDRAFSMIRSTERGMIIGGVSNKQFAIARVSTEGTLDNTFSDDGLVLTGFGDTSVTAFGLARGPGKRFTAAGGAFFASARYLEAGANEISINTINPDGFEAGSDIASFIVSRVERLSTPLRVYYTVGGTASFPDDYTGLTLTKGTIRSDLNPIPVTTTALIGPVPSQSADHASEMDAGPAGVIPPAGPKVGFVDILANQTFALVNITPINDDLIEGDETVVLTVNDTATYDLGRPSSVTLNIFDSDSKTLNPMDDALVKQGTNADVNFGSSKTLQARNKTDANRRTYLKFDVSDVGQLAIQSYKLRLFGNLESLTESNITSSVFPVADTSWDESTITWNNKPANGSPALAQTTLIDNTFRWYEWDITSYVKAEKAAGRNIISLVVRNATPSDAIASFNSKEAAVNAPQLFVIPRTFIRL